GRAGRGPDPPRDAGAAGAGRRARARGDRARPAGEPVRRGGGREVRGAAGPAPAGGERPPLHHHRHEDRHRPRAHRRPGGEHRPARHRAPPGAPAQALRRPAADGGDGPADGQGKPGRLRGPRHRAGARGVRGGRGGGRPQGADLPRALDLHDGGSADHPARPSPHPHLALHGAGGRPRHQYRGDGGVHGGGQDGAPHPGLGRAPTMYTLGVSADRRYHLQSEEANRAVDALLEQLRVPEGQWRLYSDMLTTVLKLYEDGAGVVDLKITSAALKELRYGYKVFAPWRNVPKVTVFGSARTPGDHPVSQQAHAFGKRMISSGWMVMTGAGSGVMGSAQEGAGREKSFGLNIRLPFEQEANPWILDDPKLITFKYFFTRKLFLVREAQAMAYFPGGFGTADEAFETLTLIQTGKAALVPVVLVDAPGGKYWESFEGFIRDHMAGEGMISPEDFALYRR